MSNLNSSQKEAEDKFIDCLFEPDKKYIHIQGRAGTGKSYLINHLINHCIPNYLNVCNALSIKPIYDRVSITATTNKAAAVLSDYLTGIDPVETVHSFFGLKVTEDYSTGETKLTTTARSFPKENLIIIIDEAYMIDYTLMNYIRDLTTKSCKVVFVGDPYQLPPVKETKSAILNYMDELIVLDTPMRNANSKPLMNLCDQFVQTIDTGIFKPITGVSGFIELLDDNNAEDTLKSILTHPDEEVKILGYTNQRVQDYNQYLRDLRNLSELFNVGEYVYNNSTVTSVTNQLSKINTIYTDQKLLVTGANQTTDTINIAGIDIEIQKLTLNDTRIGQNYFIDYSLDHDHLKQVIKYFAKQKDWVNYFKVKNNLPDIRMGDCRTIHKAQGSTYREVFIDLNDLGTCTSNTQIAHLLYVAVSRATDKVYLYGELPKRIFT